MHRRPVEADPQQHRILDVQRHEDGVPLEHDRGQPAPRDVRRDLLAAARRHRHQAERRLRAGQPELLRARLPNHDFDAAEYAWLGGPDPSGFDAIYQCQDNAKNLGGSNYKLYCNKKVDSLIDLGDTELNPVKRTAYYQQAATLIANDVPIVPLYAPPSILVYKSAIKGMENSNNPTLLGPTWNIEQWHW